MGDDVPQIAERDQFAEFQVIAAAAQRFLDEFEVGALALEGAREVDEDVEERRGQHVELPEVVPGRLGAALGVLLPEGFVNLAPSAVAADGQVYTHEGPKDFVTPRELTDAEIRTTVEDFATAARNAVEAGFRRRTARCQRLPNPSVPLPQQQPAQRQLGRLG